MFWWLSVAARFRFVEKHRDKPLIARTLAQDRFEYDVAFERTESTLAREIDLRHAAGGEVSDDLVSTNLRQGSGGLRRRHLSSRIECLMRCVKRTRRAGVQTFFDGHTYMVHVREPTFQSLAIAQTFPQDTAALRR